MRRRCLSPRVPYLLLVACGLAAVVCGCGRKAATSEAPPTPSPPAPELRRLEQETDAVLAQQAKLESQLKTLEAQIQAANANGEATRVSELEARSDELNDENEALGQKLDKLLDEQTKLLGPGNDEAADDPGTPDPEAKGTP
jgi:septal ring factor EnvC (AmiA/AmiB activator)